jgi:hypothetical protein
MKNSLIVITIFILLCSFIIPFNDVSAQTSTIIIRSDGTVSASSGIQRDGDTYVLTTDLNSPIEIQKNNVIVDGANHTLQGSGKNNELAAISLKASNVTITNFYIANWTAGIHGAYTNNTITANEFSDTNRAIALYETNYVVNGNIIQISVSGIYIKLDTVNPTKGNNLITNNQIINNQWAFNIINSNGTTITQNYVANNEVVLTISGGQNGDYRDAGYHLFYLNDFINNKQVLYVNPMVAGGPFVSGLSPISPAGNWDNGTAGNHWSDYTTKYPNASEISNMGIGNTQYLIETEPISWSHGNGEEGTTILGRAVDRYPLVYVGDISTDTKPQPSLTNSPSVSSSNSPNALNNIPNKYVVVVILVLAILVTGLIAITCRKKA